MSQVSTRSRRRMSRQDAEIWLQDAADELAPQLSALDARDVAELLNGFTAQVLHTVSQKNRRERQRQQQAQGIAQAKARGVKFGRPAIPLPDNFFDIHAQWRSKKISLQQAASACGMPPGTFYSKAVRFEQTQQP